MCDMLIFRVWFENSIEIYSLLLVFIILDSPFTHQHNSDTILDGWNQLVYTFTWNNFGFFVQISRAFEVNQIKCAFGYF